MKTLRKKMASAAAVLFACATIAAPVAAQDQQGLVNVIVSDIVIGDVISNNEVTVPVAANVVLTLCGTTVNVGVLAQAVFRDGGFTCTSTSGDQLIEVVH
jgi:hypothetical protein